MNYVTIIVLENCTVNATDALASLQNEPILMDTIKATPNGHTIGFIKVCTI